MRPIQARHAILAMLTAGWSAGSAHAQPAAISRRPSPTPAPPGDMRCVDAQFVTVFPRESYAGFAPMRKLLPPAN